MNRKSGRLRIAKTNTKVEGEKDIHRHRRKYHYNKMIRINMADTRAIVFFS